MTSELPDNADQTPVQPREQPTLPAQQVAPTPAVEHIEELTPQEAEAITRDALPTTVRRAPKLGRFFLVGAVVGIAVGLFLGLWLSDADMTKRGIYLTVIVVSVTTVVELIIGGIVIYLDKRSTRAATQ